MNCIKNWRGNVFYVNQLENNGSLGNEESVVYCYHITFIPIQNEPFWVKECLPP